MNAVHNARIQLLATLLNTMAGSSFTVGVAAPVAAVFFYGATATSVGIGTIVIGILSWLGAATTLHGAAWYVLGRLRQ